MDALVQPQMAHVMHQFPEFYAFVRAANPHEVHGRLGILLGHCACQLNEQIRAFAPVRGASPPDDDGALRYVLTGVELRPGFACPGIFIWAEWYEFMHDIDPLL